MPLSRTRVLYVDDDPELRLCVEGILSRAGYDVSVAASAEPALTYLGRRHYDLVIADQWMPGETGTELLDRARALGLMRRTRGAIVTADPGTAETTPGVQMKPMGEFALLSYVAHQLRRPRRFPLRRVLSLAAGIALAVASLGVAARFTLEQRSAAAGTRAG